MAKQRSKKQTGLGKGLGALIGQTEQSFQQVLEERNKKSETVMDLKIDEVSPNKDQPRKEFDEEKLEELANSIKEHGILQPIIVIKKEDPDYYMIVAGERRWRAAQIAGLKTIPALVRKTQADLVLQHSLIENIQRENLSPLEEAEAYQKLMKDYQFTQEELAEKLGKSRPSIANSLRLNRLPVLVKKELASGKITAGHARALLSLAKAADQEIACKKIIEDGLSVRQTEILVNRLQEKKAKSRREYKLDPASKLGIIRVETDLSKLLGTRVRLKDRSGKGKIEISYSSNDELDRLIEILKGQ